MLFSQGQSSVTGGDYSVIGQTTHHSLSICRRQLENLFASESDHVDMAFSMKLLGGNEAALQLEIIQLQHNNALKSMHKDSPESTPTNFWMKYVDVNDFPELSKCCKKILTMFGSTYVCEAGFSALNNNKSKKRNALTDHLLRAAVTQYEPEIKVAAALQSQPSRWLLTLTNCDFVRTALFLFHWCLLWCL